MGSDGRKIELVTFDIASLKADRFSHAQAMVITGLTNDTLQTWGKRGFLVRTGAEANREKLRGHRRKYSIADLIYLVVMAELAACGMPLAFAAANAVASLTIVIQTLQFNIGLCRAGLPLPSLFMIAWEMDGEFKTDLFTPKTSTDGNYTLQSLEDFLLSLTSVRVSVIDLQRLLTRFQHRLAAARDLEK